eukprot:1160274-Pelagomonas_calceolata.AAC.6
MLYLTPCATCGVHYPCVHLTHADAHAVVVPALARQPPGQHFQAHMELENHCCWCCWCCYCMHVICRHYRKRTIATMSTLNYLDDAPVFPKDRRIAVAFCEGGLEAERR